MKFPYHFRRTRVKICGFTRERDAVAAANLGVDAIGLVFYADSPRAVDITKAKRIIDVLPPFVSVVALFVNESESRVREVLGHLKIDLIQFHGEESPEICESFGMPYIKAIGMRDQVDLIAAAKRYKRASALLLDAWHPEMKGGTGTQFDWSRIPDESSLRIVLAGGLTVDNVALALKTVGPYALDVSSGVESEKGQKDAGKMAAFLDEVYHFEYAKYNER